MRYQPHMSTSTAPDGGDRADSYMDVQRSLSRERRFDQAKGPEPQQ